jgi:hypothetical protein
MGLLILDTDFTGKWKLALGNNDEVDAYISIYEEKFLIELLGKELYLLFAAVVTNQAVAAGIYKTIYDPFSLKINGCIVTSEGMKKMLLGLLYFEYVRDNKVKQSMNGAVEQQTEVSAFTDNTLLYVKYNEAVKTYTAIQAYIYDQLAVYPTFEGVIKKKTSFI